MAWMNDDGLYIKFGTEKTETQDTGEYKTYGALRQIETNVSLADLSTSPTILADNTFFPLAFTESVEIIVDTASTSTAGVLNVGLIATNRSTEYDYDGFVTGLLPTYLDAAGEKTILTAGSSGAGAFIGARTTQVGYLVATRSTSTTFAGGTVTVRLNYRP